MDIQLFLKKSEKLVFTYYVSSDVYYSFQRCNNDYNPMHADDSYAKQSGFDGRVMYGNILHLLRA